ncbi:MAG: class I SAM-dependent methyltransferase [Nostocales cyanobacterium ELA583]|jgi:ubiquinone/menaquinone biosynthesis C-methylase UbiE
MSLNPDGVFDPDGYYTQPRGVAQQIQELDAKTVLELGCGKGFNSCFLAQQYPEVHFTGIDLTPSHIKIASRKADKFPNLSFQEGNFNHLNFLDQSFDIVFAFECLCHASEPETPLAEIFRVLRPGGKLIVFDGYRQINFAQLPKLLQTATQLVEISMAVRHGFSEINDWNAIVQSIGFQVQAIEDISLEIQPTLLKLQKLSLKLFFLSWQLKILIYLLPKYLVRNAIAGLLMPFTVSPKGEAFGYYKLILERPLET